MRTLVLILALFLVPPSFAKETEEDRFREISELLDSENAKFSLDLYRHSSDDDEVSVDVGKVAHGVGALGGAVGVGGTTYALVKLYQKRPIISIPAAIGFGGMTLYLLATAGDTARLWNLPEIRDPGRTGMGLILGGTANGLMGFFAYRRWSHFGYHSFVATIAIGNTSAAAVSGYEGSVNLSADGGPSEEKSVKIDELLPPDKAQNLWTDQLAHFLGFHKSPRKLAKVKERFHELAQQETVFDPFLEISEIIDEDGEPVISEELAADAHALAQKAGESFHQLIEKLPATFSQKERAQSGLALLQENITALKHLFEENPSDDLARAIRRGEQVEARVKLGMI